MGSGHWLLAISPFQPMASKSTKPQDFLRVLSFISHLRTLLLYLTVPTKQLSPANSLTMEFNGTSSSFKGAK